MTLLFIGLVAGGLMGWGACDTNYRAHKEIVRSKHDAEKKELQVEIDRARAQVAGLIGVEKPASTCCGDATHGCMV